LAKEEVKMKTLLRLLLKSQHQRNRSGPDQTDKGMTLVELLVGSIMAFLIITPMLAFVVDMLNTDRREQVKANTEQDIQAAVDFIARDLSQAIYIYDNNSDITRTPNNTPTGIPALVAGNFIPQKPNETPILVFWKRELIKNSLPLTAGDEPDSCTTLADANTCNDTYVLALVAYYQVSGSPGIWCQPSGGDCPSRIVRYQIKDGLRNPSSTDIDPLKNYFTGVSPAQKRSDAFNPVFDISKPTEDVTISADFGDPEVLVNYIDHTSPGPTVPDCTTALGNPTIQKGVTTEPIPEERLKIVGATNSFYACVDTQRNIARVTLRGNSLRRIQTDKAHYEAKKAAYFPTASVQVQGLGARGQ
jgi:type II secretory pathway pseudopilin PulG